MKNLICVTNKEMADKLAEMGYRYMIQQLSEDNIYTFVENERLFELLKDRQQFNKKFWYIDKRLRF